MTIKSSVHYIDDNNEFIVHIYIYYGCSLWIKKSWKNKVKKISSVKKCFFSSFFPTFCFWNQGHNKVPRITKLYQPYLEQMF